MELRNCFEKNCKAWGQWSIWTLCPVTCGGGEIQRSRDCAEGEPGTGACAGLATEMKKCAEMACPTWSEWGDWSVCDVTCGGGKSTRVRICTVGDDKECGAEESIQNQSCNEQECPAWSEWGAWSECDVTCGGGESVRGRICIGGNNADECGGGLGIEINVCNDKACGEQRQWGDWSACSASCGGGVKTRNTICVGDTSCFGDDSSEDQPCNEQACPTWSEWGDWSVCDVTCGRGESTRVRVCTIGDDNKACGDGDSIQNQSCNIQECPTWSEWGDWSVCDVTCGGGESTRIRLCIGGNDKECGNDDSIQSRPCNEQGCVKGWSDFGNWSKCSATCGGGEMIRIRICAGGFPRLDCTGQTIERQDCNVAACGEWTPWGDWSECSVTCGEGEMERKRTCSAGDCTGLTTETTTCANPSCPKWSLWRPWSECEATCGMAERVRLRECIGGIAEIECIGDEAQAEECDLQDCASWDEWADWTECSVSCGIGEKWRNRLCINGEIGVDCTGQEEEMTQCTEKSCEGWAVWGFWSQCTATCGGGERTRLRECSGGQPGVGGCRGEVDEMETCGESTCEGWTEWGIWSQCTASCGGGERIRTRGCTGGESGVGGCQGGAEEIAICGESTCEGWREWRVWSQCTATCGGGERIRVRQCAGGKPGVGGCQGGAEEFGICGESNCEGWTEWGIWSQCTASCGGGERTRTRGCTGGEPGVGGCQGGAEEIGICGESNCEGWTEWGIWSQCTASCGGGERIRTRECTGGEPGVGGCQGGAKEIGICGESNCEKWTEWGTWSQCTATCGGGERIRTRECTGGEPGVGGCQGIAKDIGMCGGTSAEGCPIWSPWSTWSECSSTCGGGKKTHTRICINQHIGDGCGDGPSTEALDCSQQDCPYWGVWTSWSGCSKTCDGGAKERSRECINGYPGDIGCDEDNEIGEYDTEICNSQICPRFGPWSEWTVCNASCGGQGIRMHTRECVGGEVGQRGCEGPVSEDQECEGKPCPFWSPWDSWGICSKPCGGGVRSRGRLCVHGQPGKPGCKGPDSQSEMCNDQTCAAWSTWGEWSTCSRSCGDAERFRLRICVNGEIGLPGCDEGESTEFVSCTFKKCSNGCFPDYEEPGLQYGSVNCTGFTDIGSICTFTCGDKYQVIGNDVATCKEVTPGVAEWTSKSPICTERCSDATDIVFVIDSSSSIKKTNFKIIRSFIKQVVERFRVGPDAALIGAIRYNANVSKLWDLKDYSTQSQVLKAIDSIPYDGSGTMTGQAIKFTHDYMLKAEAGQRPGVPKVVVVITDGVSFDDVRRPSELLKSQGALIVAVGIGNVNIDEINDIASDPDRNFATTVSDFDSLPKVVSTIADQVKLCQPVDIPENCPPQALVDLVFIVDSSSSVGANNFDVMRKFITNVVSEFNVGYSAAMFGLILYNREVKEEFQLQDYETKSQVVNAIFELPYQGFGTRTGKALSFAAANAFASHAGSRVGVPKVAIVITDGKSQDNVKAGAAQLKEKANVIAIGIEGAVRSELNTIASYESNVFSTDFAKLNEVMGQLKMAVCFASRAGIITMP